MSENILIIGANGGIAKALIASLCENTTNTVYTVSRSQITTSYGNQHHQQLDSSNEEAVKAYVQSFISKGVALDKVICTTGVLHTSGDKTLKPEKRLEDIHPDQLSEYFRVNTIVPAIWLKYLVKAMRKERAVIVFLSARVGSISENGLGGWYGYRASKAALNMIMKTASVEYKRRSANTILGCYHPGTVDTELSKPFQNNVKPGKLFTAEFTATQLLAHIDTFDVENGPYYFDWEGKTIQY